MKPELAALIVHDLKNELGGLEGELAALASATDGGDSAAQQAHEHCRALRQRFVMFLALYGIGGAMRAHAADESPADLLRSLASAAPGALPEISVCPDIEAALPFWYFDRHLVRLALQAALHNAQRFARRQVALGARREGAFMVVTIDDDGPGLGAVDPSADHSTGLGTGLCAAVAQAHRNAGREGRITLTDRPGGGARFELWLP